MKIGMLTSGGDCQGLNSALRGVAKTLYNEFGKDVTLYGIRDGYRGLIEGDYHPMKPEEFSDILTLGGTILGTSRQPFKMMQKADENEETKLQKMLETCKKARFDCLVILGGNGTHKTANLLSEHGVNVVTLPKTIDNDLWGTDLTFGFESAVNIATSVIDSIHSTAFSHSRVFIVETMGHKAGWLTLYAGIASGADVIVIPEIPYSAKAIARAIEKRAGGCRRCHQPAGSQDEQKGIQGSAQEYALSLDFLPSGRRAERADRSGNPRHHPRTLSARRCALPGRPSAHHPFGRCSGKLHSRRQVRQHGCHPGQ